MPELAAWVVASAAALAIEGVASLTYFEEWGPRGIRGADGAPFPVAGALEALASLAPGTLLSAASPDGLVWAVGSRRGDGDTVLAANLAAQPRRVRVELPPRGRGAASDLLFELSPRSWQRVAR
jgi:hypothetical protein